MIKQFYDTPLGQMIALEKDKCLVGLYFVDQHNLPTFVHQATETQSVLFTNLVQQLNNYYQKQGHAFSINTHSQGTNFQKKAWHVLKKIPRGQTITYKDQALSMGMPKAARACGQANGRNPLAIIVPCHRVIRSNEDLGGYAGDPQRKKWLLHHESALKK